MKNRVEQLIAKGKLDKNVKVIARGYEPVDGYLKAADVIISKMGGGVIAESAALKQALASHAALAGHEENNYELMNREKAIVPLKVEDLNDIDTFLARAEVARQGMGRAFPNAWDVPTEAANAVEQYAVGKIAESAKEQEQLGLDIERRQAKTSGRRTARIPDRARATQTRWSPRVP